jgi:uncharacterized protein YdeI (YjbR/CyaY-like superfamily)
MTLAAFPSPQAFRAWLAQHHKTASELVVRCSKARAREGGLTYAEALDEALCFGWIDGVRRSVDAESFSVRFSPRKSESIWSAVNIRKAAALEAAGPMRPPGRAAFAAREKRSSKRYSYESKPKALDPAFERKLKRHNRAWAYFRSQPPSYRRTSIFWVMEAKREETRARRFGTLLECSAKGERIPLLRRGMRYHQGTPTPWRRSRRSEQAQRRSITPQTTRDPELPLGSVF